MPLSQQQQQQQQQQQNEDDNTESSTNNCLKDLKDTYYKSVSNVEAYLDDDDGGGGGDGKEKQQVKLSTVEEMLYEVLHLNDGEDQNEIQTRKSIASDTDGASTAYKLRDSIQQQPLSQQQPHTYPCKDGYNELPINPVHWPQRPLMIRPAYNSSTKIIGIVSTPNI
jgi:hypothetical protein